MKRCLACETNDAAYTGGVFCPPCVKQRPLADLLKTLDGIAWAQELRAEMDRHAGEESES